MVEKHSIPYPCPVRDVLERLTDRWTILVMRELMDGTQRFSELRRGVEGISPRMLSQTLRNLEQDGLILREVLPAVPPKVQYSLKPLGSSFFEIIQHMVGWAKAHQDEVLTARASYRPPEGYEAK